MNEQINERIKKIKEWINMYINEWFWFVTVGNLLTSIGNCTVLNLWIYEWLIEWMNEWMNERMHEWMNEWMNGRFG